MARLVQEMEEQKRLVVEDYFKEALLTNKYMFRDFESCVKIQRSWKMHLIRKKFMQKKDAAMTLQRYIRGYLAWKKVFLMKVSLQEKRNISYFEFHAMIIQKWYRGSRYRKFYHDYYARKKQLAKIKEESEKRLQEMREYAETQAIELEEEQAKREKEEFENLASNFHHLVSTSHIPGVYNPPFAEKPVAFGREYESHLKTIFRKNYTWKPPNLGAIKTFKRNLGPLHRKPQGTINDTNLI